MIASWRTLGVLLLVVRVREERGDRLLVLEVAEDLDRGGDRAVRVAAFFFCVSRNFSVSAR